MAKHKPDIAFACLAEKVLSEKDGVVSLIRIVDTFTVATPPGLPEGVKPNLLVHLVLGLRQPVGAAVSGEHQLSITLVGPTKTADPQTMPVDLKDGTASANVVLAVVLGVGNYGPCRFEVTWDGEPLVSVPFTLKQPEAVNDGESGPKK